MNGCAVPGSSIEDLPGTDAGVLTITGGYVDLDSEPGCAVSLTQSPVFGMPARADAGCPYVFGPLGSANPLDYAGLNVSGVATAALTEELDRRARVAALDEYLAQLEEELGPVPPDEAAAAKAWADDLEARTTTSSTRDRRAG